MLETNRLTLLPAFQESLEAELESRDALGTILQAIVPKSWPPEHYNDDAVRWVLNQWKDETNLGCRNWLLWYCLQRTDDTRLLVGTVGFKGPPNEEGIIELGYSLVTEFQGQGFATEAAFALIHWAFDRQQVNTIQAQTLAGHMKSIAVLERLHFQVVGTGHDDGLETVIYELSKPDWVTTSRDG